MNVIIELLIALLGLIYSYFDAFVRLFLPSKRKDVTGKNILITGSAQGLGREMAIRFHALGANLALLDINEVSLQLILNLITFA